MSSGKLLVSGILCLCFSIGIVISQSDTTITTTYDYTQFRLPDIDRRALVVVPYMRHQNNDQTARGTTPFSMQDRSLSQQFTLDYNHFKNSKFLQALRQVEFTQGFDSRKRTNSSSNADLLDRDFYSRVYTSGVNRKFHFRTAFTELNWEAFASYSNSKISSINTNLEQYSYWVRIPIKMGKGRVEPVDELFIAKFMADDMLKAGIIDTPLPKDELFALGQVMAHARNQRIFDFRRQRQYEFSQLDNWFKDLGRVRVDNILYYNTMADNWLYAFNNPRMNGKYISLGLAPGYNFFSLNREPPDTYISFRGVAEWSRFKPLNQYWQLDLTAEVEAVQIYYNRSLRSGYRESIFSPGLKMSVNVGYFPNSRTRILTYASLQNRLFLFNSREVFDFRPKAGAFTSYFLSYRMRLTVNFDLLYSRTSESTQFNPFIVPTPGRSSLQTTSRITFEYSIF